MPYVVQGSGFRRLFARALAALRPARQGYRVETVRDLLAPTRPVRRGPARIPLTVRSDR